MTFVYLEPELYYGQHPYTDETHQYSPIYSVNPNTGKCTTQAGVNVIKAFDENVLPLYAGTRHDWAPAVPPLTGNIRYGQPGSESYAQLYPPEKPRPVELAYGLPEIRRGGGLSKADFERRKREGKIVLQGRHVAKTRAIVAPGIRRDDLSQHTLVLLWRGREGTFPRGEHAACGATGIICSDPPSIIYGSKDTHPVESNARVGYHRYRWHGTWEYPSPGVVVEMMESLQRSIIATPQNNGVVTSALAEANNLYWDVLTEIAELPELIRYILDGLKEILNLSKTFKKARRDLVKAGGSLSELSSLWLQYRYAVMPIVYSIEDMMKYLSAHSSVYLSTRKRANSFVPPPEIPGWTVSGEIPIIQRCFLKRKFDLSVGDSVFLTVNPLLTAWEKVTLSFVIDWAVNVGDFLAALVPPRGIEEERALYSEQVPEGTSIVYTSTDHIGMTVTVTTGVYHAYPINPRANIGLTFDPKLTWERKLDALALSWQLFLKRYFNR